MILTKKYIKKLLDEKTLVVAPDPELKESSIKIRLGDTFARIGEEFIQQDSVVLKPKEFILGKTLEHITMPKNIAGLYDGFTHLARKGIMTHMGSMYVEPESDGQLTLEIFNGSDKEITLEKGMRVGQLILMDVKQ
jgi:dCTP deaminase